MEKLFTPREVADILKVHENSIYTYLKSGRLKGIRPGKGSMWRIKESALDKFLATK